jgi:DNA-binding transcriptional ArsR family regulator
MLEEKVKIFKALSDTSRIRIMKMLQNGEVCVCDIQSVLGLAMSTVSNHLSILKVSGLIVDRKEGKWSFYKLNDRSSDPNIQQMLILITGWLEKDLTITKDSKKIIACCR